MAERAAVHAALAEARLVTLTGVGGTGKTRLALQVAREAADGARFADGVTFADLAPLREPALLALTLARALGLVEQPALLPEAHLIQTLHARHLLLVADNLEHLLEEAPLLGRLLAAAPRLHVLATSRVPLRLYGEHEIRVPPLPLPGGGGGPAEAAASEAVQLFVARARAVAPGFAPTGPTLAVVAAICAALDGLPLAIELAAPRVRLFPPEALLPLLRTRLSVLTGGPRDRPERQRTMRATLDWSYALLPPEEQTLFAGLGVFAGAFDATAAATVCLGDPGAGADAATVNRLADAQLGRLAALADQSLLEAVPGPTPRFRLLETVREYALARLAEGGTLDAMQRRHARYVLAVAEAAERHLDGPGQAAALERLAQEHDNLRAALRWALPEDDPAGGVGGDPAPLQGERVALGQRLAGALGHFWERQGHLAEGRRWLERALAADAGAAPASAPARRATLLHVAGPFAHHQGDFAQAVAWLEEALTLRRALRDRRGAANVLNVLGSVVAEMGEMGRAMAFHRESLALLAEQEQERGAEEGAKEGAQADAATSATRACALSQLGHIARRQGDYGRATAWFEQSWALYRDLGDADGGAQVLLGLSDIARDQGDAARAQAWAEESLAVFRACADRIWSGYAMHNLGLAAWQRGAAAEAVALLEESVALFRELGGGLGLAEVLTSRGQVARAQGDLGHAAALLGEAVQLAARDQSRLLLAAGLEGLAAVTAARGRAGRAARLVGAAAGIRAAMGAPLPPAGRAAQEWTVRTTRAALGADAFAAAWAEGLAWPPEQAVAAALLAEPAEAVRSGSWQQAKRQGRWHG